VLLQAVISDVFTIASGVGIMPAVAILAAKHPKIAALLIPNAPLKSLGVFYLPNVSDRKELDPMDSITHSLMLPRSIKVLPLVVQEFGAPFQR
jgi:hypothetical protein